LLHEDPSIDPFEVREQPRTSDKFVSRLGDEINARTNGPFSFHLTNLSYKLTDELLSAHFEQILGTKDFRCRVFIWRVEI
jgi:hypothetical protein